jgi:hypothetical protein
VTQPIAAPCIPSYGGGFNTDDVYPEHEGNEFHSVEVPTRCSFVVEFIIPKFIEGSTCFERHTAHRQALYTVHLLSSF